MMRPDGKKASIYSQESIRAMSPAAQALAEMLASEGWVVIQDQPQKVKA